MSESSKGPDTPKSDPPEKPDSPEADPAKSDPFKKLEARTAGAPNINADVFKLPDYPGAEIGAAHTPPGEEEKIGLTEALRMKGKNWAKEARRKSGDILTLFGSKKDGDKKDEDKKDGSKDGCSNPNTV